MIALIGTMIAVMIVMFAEFVPSPTAHLGRKGRVEYAYGLTFTPPLNLGLALLGFGMMYQL